MEQTHQQVKTEDRLEKLGFKAASKRVTELRERQRKLAIAYEHFRFVRQEKIDAFNRKLREKTHNWDKIGGYHTLAFVKIEGYEGAPPTPVLDALESAMEKKCFDSYEVAYIREVKDPIIFGRIDKCSDRFYVAQWDDDVSIDDLIGPNEG